MKIKVSKLPIDFLSDCISKLPNDLEIIKSLNYEVRFMYKEYIIIFVYTYSDNQWSLIMDSVQGVNVEPILYDSPNPQIPYDEPKKKHDDPVFDIIVPC